MSSIKVRQSGFTIVELLIVIVVIAILATISIVAFNGVQERARVSAVSSALSQSAKKLTLWQVEHSGQFPATLADAGISDTSNVQYQYTSDNSTSPATYCLTATYGSTIYNVSSSRSSPQSGACSGYNLLVWNKQDDATVPVRNVAVDNSVFRTSIASMRLGPGEPGRGLLTSPYDVTPGEVFTVKFWLLTDSNWNGTGSNSKVRFGNAVGGGIIKACGYQGVKTVWTEVVCDYTIPSSGLSQMTISVGNDGSVGNIWVDDFSLSRS